MRPRRTNGDNRLHQTPSGENQGFGNMLDRVYSAAFGTTSSWVCRTSGNSRKRSRVQVSLEDALGLPSKWPPLQKKSRAKRARSQKAWSRSISSTPQMAEYEADGRKSCGLNPGDGKLNGCAATDRSGMRKEVLGGNCSMQLQRPCKKRTSEQELKEETSPKRSKYTRAVPMQSAVKKSEIAARKRVRFKKGCLGEKYGTEDGHPIHDGRTPQPHGCGGSVPSSMKKQLTWKKIREVEVLLEGTCDASLVRLRRRAGLEPLRVPDLKYLTNIRKGKMQQA